jgi:hypothetical protein
VAAPSHAVSPQDALYSEAAGLYGAALERLARAYEPDADRRPMITGRWSG